MSGEAESGGRTALVLALADAEAQLGPVKAEFHPASVGRGLPLHLTLLYPFVGRESCDDTVVARVERICATQAAFAFSLKEVTTFPGGFICVEPEPADGVRALMRALWSEFPETPPYGGEIDDPEPHATIGWAAHGGDDPDLLEAVRRRAEPLLPIRCEIGSVALYEELELQRWQLRELVPVGSK